MIPTITAFEQSPDGGKGLVRNFPDWPAILRSGLANLNSAISRHFGYRVDLL